MKIRRAIVVLKETALTKLQSTSSRGTKRMRMLVEAHDRSVKRILPSHEEHIHTVAHVRSVLRARKIPFTERNKIPKRPLTKYDLVISVGGDGTLLSVSHTVRDRTVVLGVNSSPTYSVGFLTGCTAETFEPVLDDYCSGRLAPAEVQRLQVTIGKKKLPEPVLNDALFCATNPAMMNRYRLTWPDGEEIQRSSGIWVSTPAGSSAALRSAGGPVLPLTARQFAFLVREPYAPPGASVRIPVAVLSVDQTLQVECRILEACVFLDGSHKQYPVPFGESVAFSLHKTPLRLMRFETR